ncbi:MAG: universal stress protein [Hyphomicrobiales bacterium]|nr:universal stress protein [Hyphomicrobiales bacterium]
MIKDIVVNLLLADGRDAATEFAVSAAAALDAHLTGIAFAYEPFVPAADMFVVPADLIESQRLANEQAAGAAVARFEEAARRNAVSAQSRVIEASAAGASETFARVARRFDLSVVSQPRPDSQGSDEMLVEAAMFSSGRPVLIVPYIQQAPLTLERVMVCWDGSRTAARATADALPLLARARSTQVVTVTDGSEQTSEVPGIDFAKHLARHGIVVELKRMVRGDMDVADIILSHAADISADLIVMGGYGHSRLREFVLGGVTRRMLKSMVAPTLMSH